MGLETATNINELVDSNPADTDGATQGDDHMRLIKSVLKLVFPNNPAAMTFLDSDITLDPLFRIMGNKQVAIAGATFNGVAGCVVQGNEYGIADCQRTAAGVYEIQLTESAWGARGIDDLQMAWSVDYLVAGIGVAVLRAPVVNPIANGWCQVTTTGSAAPLTPVDSLFKVTFFDSGRT